jgi:hypothetical protein
MKDQFSLHVLPTSGVPMIHVARTKRPEIVLFGRNQMLGIPLSIEAGNEIMINSTGDGQVVLAKYTVGMPDQRRTVSPYIEEVIAAIVDLGGSYPDVVQALQEAKASGALPSRFEVDALPEAGRTYERVANSEEDINDPHLRANSPLPDLFSSGESRLDLDSTPGASENAESTESDQSSEKSEPSRSIFAKILGSHRS